MKLTSNQNKVIEKMKTIIDNIEQQIYFRYILSTKMIHAITINENDSTYNVLDPVCNLKTAYNLMDKKALVESEWNGHKVCIMNVSISQ